MAVAHKDRIDRLERRRRVPRPGVETRVRDGDGLAALEVFDITSVISELQGAGQR